MRNVGNPELHKAFEAKIDKIVDNLDYPSLFNVIYYLIFRDNGNKALWERVMKATLANKEVLPLIYYRPFKAAKFYIKGRFPEMEKDEDFLDYEDKLWYPERLFNAVP